MKTIRRDWLKRQIEQGKIEAKCNYRYSDDYAYDNAYGFGKTDWMPARISRPKYERFINRVGNSDSRCIDQDHKDGYMNFRDSDFTYKSGSAYRTDDQTIRFCPLSSESYTLRIKAVTA